jgi:hypothetical protein
MRRSMRDPNTMGWQSYVSDAHRIFCVYMYVCIQNILDRLHSTGNTTDSHYYYGLASHLIRELTIQYIGLYLENRMKNE